MRGADPSGAAPVRPRPARNDSRVPPHDLTLEGHLLGAAMLDQVAAEAAARVADSFYSPLHANVAHAIAELLSEGAPTDTASVAAKLGERGLIAGVGGESALLALMAGTPATGSAGHWAERIARMARERAVAAEATALVDAIYQGATPAAIAALADQVYTAANSEGPKVDLGLIERVSAALGLAPHEAPTAAAELAGRIRSRHINLLAEHAVADDEAAATQRLGTAHVVTARDFLAESDQPAAPLLGALISEGHNATLAAPYKAGKSTLIGAAIEALTTGGTFLGRFDTDGPRRVALLNCEMTLDDQRTLLRVLQLPDDAQARLLVLNTRGAGLCLTSPAGREWFVDHLAEHRAEVVIVDTYGAAAGPSIESENDNAGVRRFLAALDEIKALSGCPSLLMTAHGGRVAGSEGAEHARGATVIDDWADVRLVLTRDRETGTRYLASEGRSPYDLPESPLTFDPGTHQLGLAAEAVGESRAAQRALGGARAVASLVAEQQGITTSELRAAQHEAGYTSNAAKAAAVRKALGLSLIHKHQDGQKVRHYRGKLHADGAACEGGFNADVA